MEIRHFAPELPLPIIFKLTFLLCYPVCSLIPRCWLLTWCLLVHGSTEAFLQEQHCSPQQGLVVLRHFSVIHALFLERTAVCRLNTLGLEILKSSPAPPTTVPPQGQESQAHRFNKVRKDL